MGDWSTREFSSLVSSESNFDMGKLEDMYSQLQYDEYTGIYSLAEYNADDIAIEFFLGRNIEIESGEATSRRRWRCRFDSRDRRTRCCAA